MKVDYSDILKKSLKFSIRPMRWLPFFVINILFLSLFASIILSNTDLFSFMQSLQQGTQTMPDYTHMLMFFQMVISIFAVSVIWQLVKLYVTGAVTHQSYKEKEYSKSWRVSASKYLSLLLAALIVTLSIVAVSFVPYIGAFLTIVVTLIFWLFIPAIIVGNLGAIQSLQKSYNIIKNEPFTVILMWLSVVLINFLIIVLFAVPVIALFFGPYLATMVKLASSGTFDMVSLLSFIKSNPLNMIAAAIIYTVGLSVAQTFSVKAVTEYYRKFKKKRFGIF